MNGASISEGSLEAPPGKQVLNNMKVLQKMKRPGEQQNQMNQEQRDFQDKFDQISGQSKEYKAYLHAHRIDG